MLVEARDSDDGHYYDRDECHYCGVVDGVQIALMWVLGEGELYQKKEDGTRLGWRVSQDKISELYQQNFKYSKYYKMQKERNR